MVQHLWFNLPGPMGGWGVRLFFVISGFLITKLLLESRERAGDGGWRVMGRFYARRCLRIFPLYYAVILVCLAIGLGSTRQLLPWLLTYTLNFHMASQGWWEEYFAHFWSLCVEEQFYLVWPWIILFIPVRWMGWAALGLILLSVGFRAEYILSDFSSVNAIGAYILPWPSLDALGAGALLAVASGYLSDSRLSKWCTTAGLISALVIGISWIYPNKFVRIMTDDIFSSMLFAALVWRAAARRSGLMGKMLGWGPAVYVGKISYGLYVYHPLMASLPIGGMSDALDFRKFAIVTVLSLALASASWYWFEAPLNGLKRYFRDPLPVAEESGAKVG